VLLHPVSNVMAAEDLPAAMPTEATLVGRTARGAPPCSRNVLLKPNGEASYCCCSAAYLAA
jgi:hypothetical protein